MPENRSLASVLAGSERDPLSAETRHISGSEYAPVHDDHGIRRAPYGARV